MLQELGWDTLEQRRKNNKVSMMYKIANHLIDIPAEDHLHQVRSSCRGHDQRLYVPFARTKTYTHSFFPDTIRSWNHLPQSLIDAQQKEDTMKSSYEDSTLDSVEDAAPPRNRNLQ